MAEISYTVFDKTLHEVAKIKIAEKEKEVRHYLGFSSIGLECWRESYYSYRYACKREWSAAGVFAVEDGFTQEEKVANELRLLPGIELHTIDEDTGKQIGFSSILGHFKGHCDGMIKGILEAPMTWHVWEHKSVNDKKFDELVKLRDADEKTALEKWDYTYYVQAQLYMDKSTVQRHYLTVTSPGGRRRISVRTEFAGHKFMESIYEKAQTIIFGTILPSRLSEKREFYKCKWCSYQEICHDQKIPLMHCKTCANLHPVKDGEFSCEHHGKIIEKENLFTPCEYHLYNPALIQAAVISSQKDGYVYKTDSGKVIANFHKTGFPDMTVDRIDAICTSAEMYAVGYLDRIPTDKEMDDFEKKSEQPEEHI